jgi:preprotein translocase subunit SecA
MSEEWDTKGLRKWAADLTGREDLPAIPEDSESEEVVDLVDDYVDECFSDKAKRLGPEIMNEISSQVMLRVIDTRWMNYLQEMDYLKTGIGLRGFGQRDPLVEYKTEAYAAFNELVNTMYEDFLRTILRIELARAPQAEAPSALSNAKFSGPAEVDGDQGANSTLRSQARRAPVQQGARASQGGQPPQAAPDKPHTYRKDEDPDPYVGVGRNDPCPCGSGKKFKNCHGRNR